MIKVMPIVYVTNMERSLEFYEALGLKRRYDPSQMWAELEVNQTLLALHGSPAIPANQQEHIHLSLVSEISLEDLVSHLEAAGVGLERPITDEAFGRSIAVRDPDGLFIQINEHDPDLVG